MIDHLFIDAAVARFPIVERFAQRLNISPVTVPDPSLVYDLIKQSDDPWQAAKKTLFLTRNQGPFLRKCPGTREYICCDYQILNIGTYCTMDCAYCILQGYFHPPLLQYFVNHDDLFAQLAQALSQNKTLRIGTGEFTDSLIWEPWSDLSPKLIERFAGQDQSVLELKTKTTAIQHLKGLAHRKKTILSWSLNTHRIIADQERGTAGLDARLRAAAQGQAWGYPLAFHFDPIVIYPGCEAEYREVIQTLFDRIAADNIVWISMGTFRHMPDLQPIIRQRFPQSAIPYGEFITGLDGKMRYFKPMRTRIYRQMVEWIRERAPDVTLYFCMEDEAVWTHSLGFAPESKGGLPSMLDQSARRHCDLK